MSSVNTRMRSEDRRELILEAATAVFGDHGYEGATTDQVAKAAGVSQPYVVRMFGSKEQLFLEVLHRALERLLAVFRAAIPGDRRGARTGSRSPTPTSSPTAACCCRSCTRSCSAAIR